MAKRNWTESQKKEQAQKIHDWQPWKNSTGPRSLNGKATSSRNAFKNSLLERCKKLHRSVIELKRNIAHKKP